MTHLEKYKRLILERYPMAAMSPDDETVTPERVFTGIVLEMAKRIEVLEVLVARVLKGAPAAQPAATEAAPAADVPIEEKDVGQMTEEELKQMARQVNTGGGPAINPRPIVSETAPQPNKQPRPNGGNVKPAAAAT